MSTVGEALVERLKERGVEVVFGIPGVHTIELYRGLAASGIRHVTPRHEQGAGFMADGYARVSSKPGVAFVITGPGLANTLTPMGQALADSVPILVVSGVNRRDTLGRGLGLLHEMPDQLGVAARVALWAGQVDRPEALDAAIAQAFAAMQGGRPGPAHLEVPTDVMPQPARPSSTMPAVKPEPVPSDPEAIEASLRTARRPLILAGGGARSDHARIAALAERLDAPVVQTVNARGLMHGHALSVPASPSLESVRSLILASDLILALGTELGPTDYDMYDLGGLTEYPPMIRVDVCADQLGRHPAALTAQCPVAQILPPLLDALPDTGLRGGAARAETARNAALAELDDKVPGYGRLVGLVGQLRDALPGSIMVGDSTQMVYAANLFYDHDRPGGWFNGATGYGALGYAIPAAIGAAIAAPRTPVVALMGDGGAQFTLSELMVATQERLPILFVVWNNAAYLEIGNAMRESGIDVVGCDPQPPQFDHIAAACAMPHSCVPATSTGLSQGLASLLPLKGPALLELDAMVPSIA